MSQFWSNLKLDYAAIYPRERHPLSILRAFVKYNTSMPFRAAVLYRVSQHCVNMGWRWAAILTHRHTFRTLHADISPWASIGPGLRMPHPIGVVIGDSVIVGSKAVIMQGVTLGGNFLKREGGRSEPLVGDNVFIGPNAVVIGPVTIGNSVKIGANAVVTRSFGNNEIVVGIPARPIQSSPSSREPLANPVQAREDV